MSTGAGAAPGVNADVEVFDGTRQPYSDTAQIFITAIDGNQQIALKDFYDTSDIPLRLPFHDNLGDNYTIVASAKGYKQAGFAPVHVTDQSVQLVRLMLLPQSNQFNFSAAKWPALKTARPGFASLFSAGAADDAAAGTRYSDLEDVQNGSVLACLLNITTAMLQISLPSVSLPGATPVDYIKEINWELTGDFKMAQDRFFGWADPAIIKQLDIAKQQGTFADAPFGLHPGATKSYKQLEFGEANVQLTFHEGDKKTVNGLDCIMIEPDIDYFRSALAHLFLEVTVNAFGSLTDPRQVYVLRWIAGQRAGIPEFDPLYTIEAA